MIVSRSLKGHGFEVVQAGHGRDAMDHLEAGERFELAMVDWNMPEMNGLEFVQAVRANPDYNDMRLVMVTTEAEMSQVVKALEQGANEYIFKPFSKEAIAEKLQILGLVEA